MSDSGDDKDKVPQSAAEKRKAEKEDIDGEPMEKKKVSMSFGLMKKPAEQKISMSFGMKKSAEQKVNPIKMSLGSQKPKEPVTVKPKSISVANVFNPDSESDEEEMPPEAKMRMKNIGRDTPTAAGPNSFGKGKLGFCDRTKLFERDLKKQMDEVGEKD